MRPSPSRLATFALAAAFLLAATACSDTQTTKIKVLAAASLTNAFSDIAAAYERAHPGSEVQLSFAGSDILANQIVEGAPADVFASADAAQMEVVRAAGLTAKRPKPFVTNRLVVITPSDDPAHISRPTDLARPGVEVVLAGPEVPAGHYAREILRNLGIARRVDVVSHEQDVEGVVSKVRLGEADAGIVYVTDVTPAIAPEIREVAVPPRDNVVARYEIAPVSAAPGASSFTAFVLSARGRAILTRYGFGTP
jgi:molybdate transport system substrate-binding protein